MTDSDSELADAFEEAAATAEQVHGESGDDGLDGDAAETLRDPVERLADALSEASLEELLRVTGFEDAPDDVSPVDLPVVIRDADADAIVELRTLLQLADLGESWSDLSAEERAERVDRVVGDASTADDGVALEEYIDRLGHILRGDGTDGDDAAADETGADEMPADEAAADETATNEADEASAEQSTVDGADDGDGSESTVEAVVDAAAEAAGGDSGTEQDDSGADTEQSGDSDGDDELLELEDHVDRLRQLVGDERAADADADAADADAAKADAAADAEDAEATDVDADAAEADAVDDAEDAADEERAEDSPTQSTAGSRGRLSTVPTSRSDMGKMGRFSTARGK